MEQSFIAFLEDSIQKNWDLDALTDYKGATLQYKDVARKIEKLHIIFELSGIKKGDKIAVCGRNSSHWGVTFLATITYGAVIVPILHEFKADITGLITLLYSGLKPSQVSTLAALDSTRLQNELVKYFHIPASEIQNCRTYGGHGEQMAVFASTTKVKGEPLTDFIGTTRLPLTEWEELKVRVIQGGKHIIDLRGRSSFQSPAYLSIEMIAAAMGGQPFRWPAGTYVSNGKFDHIMMAMETSITKNGVTYKEVAGTPAEQAELEKSYEHLCKLRDEVIEMGIIPAIKDWHSLNPNID